MRACVGWFMGEVPWNVESSPTPTSELHCITLWVLEITMMVCHEEGGSPSITDLHCRQFC